MRARLWPRLSEAEHRGELAGLLADRSRDHAAFMAITENGEGAGFAEAALRHDYVNGCDTTPVSFLEGIYVEPRFRRSGVARMLTMAVEAWGRDLGCVEMASDALLDNAVSHAFHAATGFAETERVVFFRKRL